jgi:adenylate cyclase
MRDISDPKETTQTRSRSLPSPELLLGVSNNPALSKTLTEALDTLVELTAATIGGERGSIFLNDAASDELYTRVADGNFSREIRMLNTTGVAGHVFTTGEGAVINDAYADERFIQKLTAKPVTRPRVFCALLC